MIIKAYYAFQFFFSMLLWLPIFYEYQKHFGLNDIQIYNIQSLYYIVFCLFELPTGFIADKRGYRFSLFLATFCLVIANALPTFWTSFTGFLTHFILIAAARSFASGASSAYLYEYLVQQKKSTEFKRIEGNARAFGLYGKVVLWPLVGAMMTYKIELPYIATTMFSSFALLTVWFYLPSEKHFIKFENENDNRDGFIQSLKNLLSSLKESPMLVMIMMQGTGIFVLARIIQVNLFQPLLKEKQFSLTSFGVVMSIMTIFEAIGASKTQWLRKIGSDKNLIFLLTTIIALSLLIMNYPGKISTIFGLIFFSLAIGFSYPIQRQLLNDNIQQPKLRASLLSAESVLDRTICAIVAPYIGLYLSSGQLVDFVRLTAFATIFIMGLLFFWSIRLEKKGT